MRCYGGSVATLMLERCSREKAFDREQDSHPTQVWDWSALRRDRVRQALGFFIGEEPALPFSPSASLTPATAVATGPPKQFAPAIAVRTSHLQCLYNHQ